jgi:hypothetical protein
MAIHIGQQPDKCPNPDCGSEGGFTFQDVRFQYDKRSQMSTLQVEQILRTRITTWTCDSCQSLIEGPVARWVESGFGGLTV